MMRDRGDSGYRGKREWPFAVFLAVMGSLFVGLLLLLVGANVYTATSAQVWGVLGDENIQGSIRLTFVTCSVTAILSILVAVPLGFVLSRYQFRGRALLDTVLDIPILLPPLVVGLSLLILMNQVPPAICVAILAAGFGGAALLASGGVVRNFFVGMGILMLIGMVFLWGEENSLEWFAGEAGVPLTFHPLGVVLAQFPVAAAFAVRTMRTVIDQVDPRFEEVARTLGAGRGQAFVRIVLPQAGRGILAAGTMAWARALGEFGPILIFAGATRGRTEVLSTSVFLELNIGNLAGAAAVSLVMIVLAVVTLLVVRVFVGQGVMK